MPVALDKEQQELLVRFQVHSTLRKMLERGDVPELEQHYQEMMRNVGPDTRHYIEGPEPYSDDWFTGQRQFVFRHIARLRSELVS